MTIGDVAKVTNRSVDDVFEAIFYANKDNASAYEDVDDKIPPHELKEVRGNKRQFNLSTRAQNKQAAFIYIYYFLLHFILLFKYYIVIVSNQKQPLSIPTEQMSLVYALHVSRWSGFWD